MSETVSGAGGTPTTVTNVATETQAWYVRLWHAALNIWNDGKNAEADVAAYTATHPQIVAAAETLEAMAPVQVREGIAVAEQLASAVVGLDAHAAATGLPMAPVKV